MPSGQLTTTVIGDEYGSTAARDTRRNHPQDRLRCAVPARSSARSAQLPLLRLRAAADLANVCVIAGRDSRSESRDALMALPCPDCQAGAARDGHEFDGGYLHPSADYTYLLHCNWCGAYYARVNYAAPLRHVPANELQHHQEVSHRR